MKKILSIAVAMIMCSLAVGQACAQQEDLGEQAKEFLQEQRVLVLEIMDMQSPTLRYETISREVDRLFDLPSIFRFVTALHAKKISYSDQYIIMDFFKRNLILNYVATTNINAKRLKLVPTITSVEELASGSTKVSVYANITDSNSEALLGCEFILLYRDGIFRIFDIKVENISMLITFRQMFNSMMENDNNDIDLLKDTLQKRIMQMEAELGAGGSSAPAIREVIIQE